MFVQHYLFYPEYEQNVYESPDAEGIDPVHLVVIKHDGLFFSVDAQLSGICGGWSVTPGYIMEVAHRVNSHACNENWHHEKIGEEANYVLFKVLKEIYWSQNHRNGVYSQHNKGTDQQNMEMNNRHWGIAYMWFFKARVPSVRIVVVNSHLRIWASINVEVGNTDDCPESCK